MEKKEMQVKSTDKVSEDIPSTNNIGNGVSQKSKAMSSTDKPKIAINATSEAETQNMPAEMAKPPTNNSDDQRTDGITSKNKELPTDSSKKPDGEHSPALNRPITSEAPPSSSKRDRTAAFGDGSEIKSPFGAPFGALIPNPHPIHSVLEKLPTQNGDEKAPTFKAQENGVAERPQKIQRLGSNEEKKDDNSSTDLSCNGDLEKQKAADSMPQNPGSSSKDAVPNDDMQLIEPAPSTETEDAFKMPECDEYFLSLVNLDPIPVSKPLRRLLPREVAQLEKDLQIGEKYCDHSDDYTWKDDWNGNLQMIDKELIMNRDTLAKNPMAKHVTITFCEWVAKFAKHADDFAGVKKLFSYIYNMVGTPPMAKRIMAHYIQRPASSIAERLKFIEDATSRILYDPIVLKQDGWTTTKADAPDGATGGAYFIGRKVLWQRTEAIIIAFVRDDGLGDLWKCMWVEDFDTFDLEADELQEGIKRWERKIAREKASGKQPKTQKTSTSTRFESSRNFTVKGIQDGIILATSYKAKTGRPWPARIMHITELKSMGQLSSRRSSSKNEIHVVFLAPYWNGQSHRTTNANSSYSTGPLFELETIDVSADTIQEYPYDISSDSLSVEKLQSAFKFLGLPKSAFPRYVDSHRIALALKSYAHGKNAENASGLDNQATQIEAYASLTDTHPLSVRTFSFPDALLNLPFEYTLSKYPLHDEKAVQVSFDCDEDTEPIMKLDMMLNALCPPKCWGNGDNNDENKIQTKEPVTPIIESPSKTPMQISSPSTTQTYSIENFCSKFFLDSLQGFGNKFGLKLIKMKLEYLISNLNEFIAEVETASTHDLRQSRLRSFLLNGMIEKGQGEDILCGPNFPEGVNQKRCLEEWRKCCERIFRRALVRMGHISTGNGVTAVLTDSRCNQHITAKGSFERAVRLPAAIRAAKNAGAGSKTSMPIITRIDESYMKIAEQNVIPMAHKASYLKRLKNKIASLPQDAKGVPLTDDSDGEGGEDTMGSRGSYTAAVTGVAAALKGVDMIVGGKCVNGFCAIRPPGHHAGKELRPMNAISNGFCLLNAAACAALYATSPLREGGLGLKRVCVVDIDVHHGNGTQDILASTYDPRFLYISTHAGGPHINGYEDDKSDDGVRRNLNNKDGIFPGRCGDTSPHKGVLNLPLGQRITPSALGTALVCQVTPAIEEFSPDLIIISAGFDAHKNDPLGLGGLSAEDFGTVTKVLCQLAKKVCSGRVLSILEGGYGVPCCRPLPNDLFLPKPISNSNSSSQEQQKISQEQQRPPPMKLLKLGNDLPDSMEDPVDWALSQKLDKCHQEGFIDCVQKHVLNLSESSDVEQKQS